MTAWQPIFRNLRPQQLPPTATPPPNTGTVRLPTDDLRSLLIRATGEPPFPPKRSISLPKDDLLRLYSHALALHDHPPTPPTPPPLPDPLPALTAKATARMHDSYARLLADPLVPPPRKEALSSELATTAAATLAALSAFATTLPAAPHFPPLAPTLRRFLAAVDSAAATFTTGPDTSASVGRATEARTLPLLQAALPPGYALHANLALTHADGAPLRQRAGCKAELDLVVVDGGGVVRCVVEIKTARRNPVAALYEDYRKLAAAVEGVRGRGVRGVLLGKGRRHLGAVTAEVAADVALVYIMGSETDDAAVEAGFRQVRSGQVGRRLALGGAGAWGVVELEGVHGGVVTLRVPGEWLAEADASLLAFLAAASGKFHLYFL